ncbi:hypothetical protein KFK09_002886 [Dendrobium nobile]|uniref:Uncharacterized protein n=1 Tax=Dendrobium nobile TaxID=94219 RepID=A0A8T3C2L5_DENNO|nr:hypothetical protein KFK09_002886 [Dendrobium nobile]
MESLPFKAFNLISKSVLWILFAAPEPHPLFSAAAAAGVVAVLYLPFHLLSIFFSPVLLSTLFLLFTLLRFGSPTPPPPPKTDFERVKLSPETERCLLSSSQNQVFCEPSLEWGGWGAPLEIIYEEYEGEEEEESGDCSPEYSKCGLPEFDGLLCYSDSDLDREEVSPQSICFRWDEEAEGLIEIALEEDNMFEIDLSACR